ncbi:MAG: hypothetical protein JW804_05435 [Sedimentisphaerales bacterium]|nr:hypothetical protein [Sedimentisphaerales bacterium]
MFAETENRADSTLQTTEEPPPVNEQVIFSNRKGIYNSGTARRQRKLLGKIDFIKPFLQQDEEILLVTTGCSPISLLEQLITGWIIVYLKQSFFIFTNKRIFHVPAQGLKYKSKIAQILYADCQELKMRGSSLSAKYWNGQKERFIINGLERRKIKSLLKETILEGFHSNAKGRVHLCPNCTTELTKDRYICDICGLEFKDEKEGRKISITYPGGGYFYTHHWWLGISDAFVETILAATIVTNIIQGLLGSVEALIAAFAVGMVLAVEKAITIFHCNHFIKEYIPKEPVTKSGKAEVPQTNSEPEFDNQQAQLGQPQDSDFRMN